MGASQVTTVDAVDIPRYMGLWYEIASVKQFFSVGLVGTTAEYALEPGGVKVVNTGRYFGPDGPISTITGSAVPVDASGARLNVSFTGANSADGPGNYWIVVLDPEYRYAVVSDPTGQSCFVLSRTKTISAELLDELLATAAERGVATGGVTLTPQP
jgi:lipocalin